MGRFLNNKEPYDKYKTVMNGTYFVDKSEILEELIPALQQEQRFFCITRPRRFGKTVMANMIAAFFEKIGEKSLFDGLRIAGYEKYKNHVGQHDVIYIDFSEMPRECSNYHEYISRIQDGIISDMIENYPEIDIKKDMAVWDILSLIFNNTGHKFIFIMDEWDAVFHMSFINEKDRENYLLFLKLLLKGQSYVELAYMTGVLPIAKYSDGSELNMFLEYNMATRVRFSEYFGFSDEEVDKLYERYLKNTKNPQITRESIREWYDGYHTAAGERLYNPRSVVCALTDNQLSNYWVSSGKYDSIFTYIKSNVDEIQNDLTFMFAGEKIPSGIQEYAATAQELKTKEEIYSAMVVYGLLTYDQGMVFIPNKELMEYIKKYQGTFLSGRGTINMEIRKATINDLDSIAAVEAECFPPAEAATKEEFSERIKYYGDHFWLMYDDEKLIAFVDGFVTDEADLTDEMYEKADMHDENGKWQMIFGVNTIPAYRKNGYAGQLLEAAIVDAKAQGRKGLVLTCKDWLVHYYAKFGFKDEGVSDKSVHGGVVWHQMRLVF